MRTIFVLFAISLASVSYANSDEVSDVTPEKAEEIFSLLSKANQVPHTCANTSMVWAHEISRMNYSAGKAFIFLTKESASYKSPNRRWAFHVAPYVKVNGTVTVLDKDYEQEPVSLKSWVNKHHGSGTCETVRSSLQDYLYELLSEKCHVRLIDSKAIWMPYQISQFDMTSMLATEEQYREGLIKSCQIAFGREKIRWSRKRCEEFLKL